jgi:formate/nitrite transporter FocA (FNT family)
MKKQMNPKMMAMTEKMKAKGAGSKADKPAAKKPMKKVAKAMMGGVMRKKSGY